MEGGLGEQGCLILAKRTLPSMFLVCKTMEWGALCVQYRDLHGQEDLHRWPKYVKTWQKSMCPARTSRGHDIFWQVFYLN